MTEQEALAIVKSVIAKRKSKWNYNQLSAFNRDDKYKKPDYPDYYPTYGLAIDMMEANRSHAEKGCFPARIFSEKSPYMTPKEFKYIKANYKQNTLIITQDLLATISRAFNDGNYTLEYQDDLPKFEKNTLQQYLDNEINTYGSLLFYMKSLFPMVKITDGEGVMAVKPYFKFVTGTDGKQTISKTDLNEPQPYYYDCSKVVAFVEEEYCLVETTAYNKSMTAPRVYTYELYDTENIWTITYSVADDATKMAVYYKHALEVLPVTKVKGLPRLIDGSVLWQTVLSFVTDILDVVALDYSTLKIVKDKCSYPIRVYPGRPCEFEYSDKEGNISKCVDGHVFDNVLGKNLECPSCNGLGLKDRFSVLHDFITNDDSKFDGPTGNKTPFQYVAPDTAILEFLSEEIARNEERARKMLHLQTSNLTIKGTENLTATGMALGDKSTSAFIKPISDQMFDTWEFLIDMIGMMRYGKDGYQKPKLTRPSNFDFNTEYDYMVEISNAIKAGMPPITIHAIMERYLHAHFHSDETVSNIFNLILSTDRLMGLQNSDIQIEVSKNIVAPWEVILHDSATTIIRDILQDDPKFFEKKIDDQQTALIEASKKIADVNKPSNNTQSAIADVLAAGSAPPAGTPPAGTPPAGTPPAGTPNPNPAPAPASAVA